MEGGMRAVKIAAIVMAVLIVLGTTVIIVTVVRRTFGPMEQPIRPFATRLDEPADSRIVGIASVRDRLAISLTGGGADRVVLIDPVTGALVGRVSLNDDVRKFNSN